MFCGGWIGYFSYELGRYIEKLPATAIDDIALPLIRLCFYDRFIAYEVELTQDDVLLVTVSPEVDYNAAIDRVRAAVGDYHSEEVGRPLTVD